MNVKKYQSSGDIGDTSNTSQSGTLRETLAEQFTAFDRTPDTLTYLARQFTMSTFSGETRERLSQQFTQSIFLTK